MLTFLLLSLLLSLPLLLAAAAVPQVKQTRLTTEDGVATVDTMVDTTT
jgi:hypothetical protein